MSKRYREAAAATMAWKVEKPLYKQAVIIQIPDAIVLSK